MKQGDTIEWVYKHSNRPVEKSEMIWSSTMERYVPVYGKATFVAMHEDIIIWHSNHGLLHAKIDDDISVIKSASGVKVAPKVVK